MSSYQRSPYQCVEISLFPERESYKGQRIDFAVIKMSTQGVSTGPVMSKSLEIILNTNGLTKAERKIRDRLRHEGVHVPGDLRKLINYSSSKKE